MPKIYEDEFDQHAWLKVGLSGNTLNIYLGSDGWNSPFGVPRYKKIAKIDFKKIQKSKD